MELGVRGHVAIVTGGGRGIGEGIAMALGGEGCRVVVWDRDAEPANKVAANIRAKGGEAIAVVGDVSNSASVAEVSQTLIDKYGEVQILVNNAGFSRIAPISEMTDKQWNDVIDTCLTGTFFCSRAFVPVMRKRQYGRIINISSRAARGDVNKVSYSAAKAGLIGFTKALAMELGADQITVNAIAPGSVPTERVRSMPGYAGDAARASDSLVQRVGTTWDIARGVLFLASPDAGFITGEVMMIAGGRGGL